MTCCVSLPSLHGTIYPLFALKLRGFAPPSPLRSLLIDYGSTRTFQIVSMIALRGLSWKLTGLDVPQELQERLARELMKQQGRPGG